MEKTVQKTVKIMELKVPSFRKMPEHFNEDDTVVSEYGANQDECSIVLDNTIYFVNDDGFLTKLNEITNVDTVDNVRKANITMKAISPKTYFNQSHKHTETEITNEPVVFAERSVESNVDSADIEQYLYWPDTPRRKGIKETQKDSFIITSTSWKESKDRKEQEKQQKNIEKDNRKQAREIKKSSQGEKHSKKKSKKSVI